MTSGYAEYKFWDETDDEKLNESGLFRTPGSFAAAMLDPAETVDVEASRTPLTDPPAADPILTIARALAKSDNPYAGRGFDVSGAYRDNAHAILADLDALRAVVTHIRANHPDLLHEAGTR